MLEPRTAAGPDSGTASPAPGMVSHAEKWTLSLLQDSHRRLADRARRLDTDQALRPSSCREWSVAQVYSHLGSGAEIGALTLAAAENGTSLPDPWEVWNRWDAKPASAMVADFADVDSNYLRDLSASVEAGRPRGPLLVPIDGRPAPLLVTLTARLVELALHEWDVAVVESGDAEVDTPAAAWLLTAFPLDIAAQAVPPAMAASSPARSIEVTIREPEDVLRIDLDHDGARISRPADVGDCDAHVTLPTAAMWVRLITGRWRPEQDNDRMDINGSITPRALSTLFPGF